MWRLDACCDDLHVRCSLFICINGTEWDASCPPSRKGVANAVDSC